MDLTPVEFALKHDIPFLNPMWPRIQKAMTEYAEQEARAYASWLGNQAIRGRTASKLWADYKAEVLDQQPNT